MPIVLVRIDDRLIHGQVLEGWVPALGAQEVLVANDVLAEDEIQKMILEAVTPETVRVTINTVDTIADILRKDGDSLVRRMIILDHPADALRLKRAGVRFDRLNLGNLRSEKGVVRLSRSVIICQPCVDALRQIIHEGVRVYIQSVPFEAPKDFPDSVVDRFDH
jgi:mannose/fructose/N-acetylgalactosamine-specific phosphotransferase system component IIB